MTEHKDLQNPNDYTDKDYQKWEYLLLDPDTSQGELEEIVMTLAHLPTEKAQELLKQFKRTARASEVDWLEPAMNEGMTWLMMPGNDQEERDMMALKLVFAKEDYVLELLGKCEKHKFWINQFKVELEILEQMEIEETHAEQKKDLGCRKSALHDLSMIEENHLDKRKTEINMEQKIIKRIKTSIQTERYQNLESWDISGFHFDGEE